MLMDSLLLLLVLRAALPGPTHVPVTYYSDPPPFRKPKSQNKFREGGGGGLLLQILNPAHTCHAEKEGMHKKVASSGQIEATNPELQAPSAVILNPSHPSHIQSGGKGAARTRLDRLRPRCTTRLLLLRNLK